MYPQVDTEEYQYTWVEAERDLAIKNFEYLDWHSYLKKVTISDDEVRPPKTPSEKQHNGIPK